MSLAMLCALILLAGGVAMRWPSVNYGSQVQLQREDTNRAAARDTGGETQSAYNDFAFGSFSYTDIASLFFRDHLYSHPRPFFDYQLEYPVGMGLVIYLLNTATSLHSYLLLSSVFLALCALLTLWLIGFIPGSNPVLLALSPALLLYVNLNWDFWGILLAIAALLLCAQGRAGWGGVLLGAALWTKFFPIVLVPLIVLVYLINLDRRAVIRLLAGFTGATLLINAPLLLFKPQAWWYFFQVNQRRSREVNLWNFFDSYHLTTGAINNWISVLLTAGMGGLLILLWRAARATNGWAHQEPAQVAPGLAALLLPAFCAAMAWFFFINKVYSPQYSLWIAVLLAAAGASPALAIAWGAADLIYFIASFGALGMQAFVRVPGANVAIEHANDWMYHYILFPAMGLREGMLLIVAVWGAWQLHRSATSRRLLDGSS
ncbi:MAG: DUF2029 domain-containing protein [Herpetosiphonaceae bacterium]|nr:DUF2029 domain-containing protein [Herpetosiphonaceae bacterium]